MWYCVVIIYFKKSGRVANLNVWVGIAIWFKSK